MTSEVLTTLAFACYLASAVGQGAFLFLRVPAAPAGSARASVRFARPLLFTGIILQFAAIGAWCVTTHLSPFASEYGTLSVTAWAIALVFALLDIRANLPGVGAVALFVACLLLFWGVAHAHTPPAQTRMLAGHLISLHVLSIVISFALFTLAGGCAALYLLQNNLLKKHKSSGLFRKLPPLETLDSVAYHSVAYALPLLTVGLALGMVKAFGGATPQSVGAWLRDTQFQVSIATWFLYVLYVLARLAAGWRGVRLQYILLAGLAIALALYVVPTTTHQFTDRM